MGDATGGVPREVNFTDDLLKRHHLYVARTRMGKSTLMHHVVTHKLREKAAGRDGDAIIVVDPHADLVAGLLEQVPESLVDKVRLIDLADERGAPGVNLLDTRVFADRDRTADSVVRVAKGLWEQWGPRMQSILEHTVKTLHEANEQRDDGEQYTILDGLKLLSDGKFRAEVLGQVNDPYLLDWWVRDFDGWHRQYRSEAIAPVQTRLAYYASSKKARAILGQSRSTIDLRETILEGGVLFVSTAQGTGRPGRGRPGGGVAAQPGGLGELGSRGTCPSTGDGARWSSWTRCSPCPESITSRCSLSWASTGRPSFSPPRAWPSWTTCPAPCRTPSWPTWAVWPCSRCPVPTPAGWCGSWAKTGSARTTSRRCRSITATCGPPWAPTACPPTP